MDRVIDYIVKNPDMVATWAIDHLIIIGVAISIALVIGLVIGIYISVPGREALADTVLYLAEIIMTIPSLAVIAIMAPILGFGFQSAIVALFVYGLLPIVRNSYTSIKNIDPAIIEAAKGMGMSRRQIAWRIELPLARPVIITGIRVSTVITVGTAELAVLVGGVGLGKITLTGVFA